MPHRIHKCTNTLYDYALINTYVSLMYELKNSRNGFTSKFVGTGSSSCEKRIYRIYRAAVLQSLRNTDIDNPATREPWIPPVIISGVTLRSDDKDREYCLLSEERENSPEKKNPKWVSELETCSGLWRCLICASLFWAASNIRSIKRSSRLARWEVYEAWQYAPFLTRKETNELYINELFERKLIAYGHVFSTCPSTGRL